VSNPLEPYRVTERTLQTSQEWGSRQWFVRSNS
jgi:hypothetical protein